MKKIDIDFIILGSGPSNGVPSIEFGWGDCDPNDPKNIRSRSSIFMGYRVNGAEQTNILFDSSPDLRNQILQNMEHIRFIDYLIYTHAHADHVFGIDDFRAINRISNKIIPAYMNDEAKEIIFKSFQYAFLPPSKDRGFYKPCLEYRPIIHNQSFSVGLIDNIVSHKQDHGYSSVSSFVIDGKIGYITDYKYIDPATKNHYKNLDLLITSCIGHKKHANHICVDELKALIKELQPKKVVVTHMGASINYQDFKVDLENFSKATNILVEPSFDNMRFSITYNK